MGTAYPQKLIGLHSWGKFNQAMREAPRDADSPVTYIGKHEKGMELLVSTDGERVIKVHAGGRVRATLTHQHLPTPIRLERGPIC